MKIFVVGSLNMDLTVQSPRIPQTGETVAGHGFMTTAGGKGANQAAAAGKMGGEVYMVGCVGEAFGGELLSSLQSANVHTEFVKREKEISSGIAIILVVEGDNRIVLDKGANARVSCAVIEEALAQAQEGDFLVCQMEIGIKETEYAIRRAKEKGMVTLLNPAPATALSPEIFPLCDYFLPNQTEAQFYTGILPADGEGAKACAEALLKKGVKNVIVTLGEQGSAGICGGAFVKAEAVKVRAVDTTGAGDSYVGALAVRLSEGVCAEEAMRFASRVSAIAVTRRGAQASIPWRKEVE